MERAHTLLPIFMTFCSSVNVLFPDGTSKTPNGHALSPSGAPRAVREIGRITLLI
ncbi:hypothetical protein ACF06X_09465 [Streptomyces sp. NPDC015346]|uniref:hypothetical protein n=1 Tax=Streptomyces sp. NPDC015346 TaxID=3364954 RepID=UPI0037027C3E